MDEISGQDYNRPNFRSENPVSIRQAREQNKLRRSEAVSYGTADALKHRAQRARNEPVENEQPAWQVQAMEYFNRRLSEINESMVIAFNEVFAELSRLNTKVDALAESVAERSEAVKVKPVLNVTVDTSQFEDGMGLAEELTAELEKCVEAIARRRAGRS